MATSKHASDPVLLDAADRIEKGEITKKQAAVAMGLSTAEFAVRIARAGLRDRLKGIRDKTGSHLFQMEPGKEERYKEAVDLAMSVGRGGAASVLRRYPDLSKVVFYRRLVAAKKAENPGYTPERGRGPSTSVYEGAPPAASLTLNPSVARP